jgi:hypothetical protein
MSYFHLVPWSVESQLSLQGEDWFLVSLIWKEELSRFSMTQVTRVHYWVAALHPLGTLTFIALIPQALKTLPLDFFAKNDK